MSNSDKEFEEWIASNSVHDELDNPDDRDVKAVWNHLYPYKERCEELEAKLSFALGTIDLNNEDIIQYKQTILRMAEGVDEMISRASYTYTNTPEFSYEKEYGLKNDVKERLIKLMKVGIKIQKETASVVERLKNEKA